MSAIFGLIHFSGQPIAANELNRMNLALKNLGADDCGIWIRKNVGVGQRLMSFTPEDCSEKLPLVSADGQLILTCDARIDNRPELSKKLSISPSEALQSPDSAFILRAFEKWGSDCLHHLIGEFSLAIWDNKEQHLLLARSPMGERSLYYNYSKNTLAFASMPKGLFAVPSIRREIDLEQVADYLVLAPLTPNKSFFKNIIKLPAGHFLVASRDNIRLEQYYSPNITNELHLPNEESYIQSFIELLERVISDHMRSTTRVGLMMSGGLDSTTIAAVAANVYKRDGKQLTTFTEVPKPGFSGNIIEGRYPDESKFVKLMAKKYNNIDINLVRPTHNSYFENITSFYNAAEIPFRSASNRFWMEAILQKTQQQRIGVLLTGLSGNLTISWNGDFLLPQLIKCGKWWSAWKESRMLTGNTHTSTFRLLLSKGIMPLLPIQLYLLIKAMRHRQPLFNTSPNPWHSYAPVNPNFSKSQRILERAKEKGFNFTFRLAPTKASRFQSLLSISTDFSDYHNGFKSLYGIDVRNPLGDMRLADFCLSLPESLFSQKGQKRRLLQQAMADKIPSVILNNNLRGLQAADWFERLRSMKTDIHNELQLLNKSHLANVVIDLPRLKHLVEHMPEDGHNARETLTNYRSILERGLMVGRFLRWFESGE